MPNFSCIKPFLYLFHPYHRSYQITHHASLPFHGCSVFLIFGLEYSVCWSFCLLIFVSPISTKHWLSDASDSEVSVFYDTNSEALSFLRKKLNKTVWHSKGQSTLTMTSTIKLWDILKHIKWKTNELHDQLVGDNDKDIKVMVDL